MIYALFSSLVIFNVTLKQHMQGLNLVILLHHDELAPGSNPPPYKGMPVSLPLLLREGLMIVL